MDTYKKHNLRMSLLDVVNCLNVLGEESEKKIEVADAFVYLHRTLQQSFMRVVIIPILKQLTKAGAEGNWDERNEATCLLATKMLDAVTEDDLHLPMI